MSSLKDAAVATAATFKAEKVAKAAETSTEREAKRLASLIEKVGFDDVIGVGPEKFIVYLKKTDQWSGGARWVPAENTGHTYRVEGDVDLWISKNLGDPTSTASISLIVACSCGARLPANLSYYPDTARTTAEQRQAKFTEALGRVLAVDHTCTACQAREDGARCQSCRREFGVTPDHFS